MLTGLGGDAAAMAEAAPASEERAEPGEGASGADGLAPRREKRSRDRYGRDRKDRAPREGGDGRDAREGEGAPAPAAFVPNDALLSAAAAEPAAPVQIATETAPALAAVAPAAAPVQAPAPAAPRAERPQPTVAAVAAAPVAEVTAMPKAAAFVLPLDELAQVAQGSGLQWVGTNVERAAAVQAAIAAEPAPVHVPRERPPAVVIDTEPLVLVETKRDLRDMQLPF